MERILFIINPIAGTKIKNVTKGLIDDCFADKQGFQYEVFYTEYAGHGQEKVKEVVESKSHDIVVIAGGDGSINEIARPLLHSGIRLGILPTGSGNGLAHHLNIPMRVKKALEIIKEGKTVSVDVGLAQNELFGKQLFLSNFGLGYDAEVIHAYSNVKQRGFLTYIFFMFQSMFTLKPKQVQIRFNGFHEVLEPFVYTVANSSQYGYKIEVAPEASISDGLLDSLLVRDATFFRVLKFSIFSLLKVRDKVTDVAEFHTTKQIEIDFKEKTKVQLDGEPFFASGKTEIGINHQALEVIVP